MLHVAPVGDAVEHTSDDDCVCGPTAKLINAHDGSDRWLMIHHSLAGREKVEEDHTTMIQSETDIGGITPSP